MHNLALHLLKEGFILFDDVFPWVVMVSQIGQVTIILLNVHAEFFQLFGIKVVVSHVEGGFSVVFHSVGQYGASEEHGLHQ